MSKEELKRLWESRIASYRASGQGATAWCAQNKVSTCQLYYWLKKENAGAAQPAWIPVEIKDACVESSLEVKVGNVRIEVKTGFDSKLLFEVVQTLAALC